MKIIFKHIHLVFIFNCYIIYIYIYLVKKVEIDTSRYSSELPGKYKDDKMEEEKDDDNENNDLLSGTMFG